MYSTVVEAVRSVVGGIMKHKVFTLSVAQSVKQVHPVIERNATCSMGESSKLEY